jgi:ABC-type transport system involved in multi-copper enzyme maturation permease subunit
MLSKTITVASHTCHQALRQPLFYVLTAGFAAMIWSSQFFTMFTLDESLEGLLLREMGISSIALCGALLSVLLSWLVITRDMERLVALTLLSKPLSRTQFLVGKYLGILAAVGFASLVLAGVLLATLWQKEAGPRVDELKNVDEITYHEPSGDAAVTVESVAPVAPEDNPLRAVVTLNKEIPERDSRAARLASLPSGGRFAQGQLSVWRDNVLRNWLILRSWNEGGRGKVEIALDRPWRGPDGAPLPAFSDPGHSHDFLPVPGSDARLAPSRFGAAQWVWARFWSFDAPQVAKGAALAVVRVAMLLAFAASLAPHASLVVNSAVSFLLFLLGHVANYLFLSLSSASHPRYIRVLGQIFYAIFPNLENSRVESLVAAGREISLSYVCWSAGYGFAYAALVLVAGAAFFSRKEIR